MTQPPIALMEKRRIVSRSAFFHSGKAVPPDRLCQSWGGILRFDPERDDRTAFRANVAGAGATRFGPGAVIASIQAA